MKAKTLKALDELIAALEGVKDALEAETTKSGDSADDGDNGKVSGRDKKAGAGGVPAKGKKSRPVPDDDADVDGDDDADADADADAEDDDLPDPKAAVKGKAAAAKKPAAAAKGKAKKGGDEADLDTVKEKLTAVMNEESLGKARVLKILKKYGATRSAELGEDDYAAVIKACDVALAETTDADDDV